MMSFLHVHYNVAVVLTFNILVSILFQLSPTLFFIALYKILILGEKMHNATVTLC